MNIIKKALLCVSVAAVALVGYGVNFMQTQYAGIGLPWTDEVDLPAFPSYPEPQSVLKDGDEGLIYFATKSPYDMTVLLGDYEQIPTMTGRGTLRMPESASAEQPVPAMILLHGSGGIAPGREERYAKFYNDLGIAVFILDYYDPRGAELDMPYTYKVLSTTEIDIIHDSIKALELLGTHPAIDGTRIGVTGYSYGGMVVRYLQDPRFKAIVAPNAPEFAAHIDTYGPCHQTMGEIKTNGAPYLSLRGDEDASISVEVCDAVEAKMAAAGTPVERHVFAGAGHAWEVDRPRVMGDHPYVTGCSFSYDAAGVPTVDGAAVRMAKPGEGRNRQAFARGMLMSDVRHCLGSGYIVGRDDDTDQKAKAIITDFVQRTLLVKGSVEALAEG